MLFRPKAIFFDLDGTLIDSAPDLTRAIDRMLVELGYPEAGLERVVTWVGNGAQKLIERALAFSGLSEDEVNARYSVAREIFDRVYIECCDQATGVYPHVDTLLKQCQALQLPMALITNKPEVFTHKILASLGFESYFDVVLGGDSLEEKKPSPLPLINAADSLGVKPEECWMIGDSKSDVDAAKKAGALPVAVSYGYNHGRPISEESPDLLFDSLKELQQQLVNLYPQTIEEPI